MELVYLWIKKYKNIHNQGFNFSPRFEYKNKKITPKSEKSIENFFGDNINITAIVGKNGTGKSNILEALVSLFAESGPPIDADYKICGVFYDETTKSYYSKDIKYSSCKFITDPMEDLDKVINKNFPIAKYESQSFLLHYNYTLDFLDNDEPNINFDKMYHKVDKYKVPILLQPDKSNSKIHLNLIDYFATRDMFEFVFKEDLPVENIEKFFKPKKFKLSFHFSYIYGDSKQDDEYTKDTELFDYIGSRSIKGNLNIHDYHNSNGIEDYSPNFEHITRDGLILLTRFYILKKASKKLSLISEEALRRALSLKDENKELKDRNYETALHIIEYNSFKELFHFEHYYQTYKIENSFKFIAFLEEQEEDYKLSDKKQLISENQKLIKNLAPWITIDIYDDKDVSLSELSYGQKFMIRFLYSLLNQLRNLNSHSEYKDILLLLDEVENGLHPQWQKEFIKLIIDVLNAFLKKYPKRFKFNIIITSHSPFILSDLPKENVIFLDNIDSDTKDKYSKLNIDKLQRGSCINVSQYIDINPFGANIHTLLSDGFFMEGGLMGEFAKNKIQEIMDFLNDEKTIEKISTKIEQLKQVIESIGEPFLKSKLLDMYNRNFIKDYKIREKEKIKEQIKLLNIKLKDLD
jgi:predicted ATP-binding protein involved in virulence